MNEKKKTTKKADTNKRKEKKKVEDDVLELTNASIENLVNSPALPNLLSESGIDSDVKFKLVDLFKSLRTSTKVASYREVKNALIEEHGVCLPDKEDDGKILSRSHPQMVKLLGAKSGLTIERLTIKKSQIKVITGQDILSTEWFINYTDD